MESVVRSLNLKQAFQAEPNFDRHAQGILENSKTTIANVAARPTKISDLLKEFGATFINSIQLQNFQKILHTNLNSNLNFNTNQYPSSRQSFNISANANADENSNNAVAVAAGNAFAFNSSSIVNANVDNAFNSSAAEMEIEFIPNHIVIDSSSFETMDEIQKQLEYDKFMNDVWIGVVLTLIFISMIFCICSCFLYHQFRTWKRNYHSTVVQVNRNDIESFKLESDLDDPVPEYTLVSGLPSYEAAMELLSKSSSKSCLIMYPSVFNVFNRNEKSTGQFDNINIKQQQQQQQQSQLQSRFIDITTPLLDNATTATTTNTNTTLTTTTALATGPCSKISNSDNGRDNDHSTKITIAISNELTDNSTDNNTLKLVNEKELSELLNDTRSTVARKPLEELKIFKN